MPYRYQKEGDKYVVYKKGSSERVGATKGTKEALRKYLAALAINTESVTPERLREAQKKFGKFMKESYDVTTQSEEGGMAKHDTMYCAMYAAKASKMISQDMDLPEWIEAYITLATDYMRTVHEFLLGHHTGMNEEVIEEGALDDKIAQAEKKVDGLKVELAKAQTELAKAKEAEAKASEKG
jgi:hypothetical protein